MCLYFLNGVYDKYNAWQFMQRPDIAERAQRWPEHFPNVGWVLLGPPARQAAGAGCHYSCSCTTLWLALRSLHLG